MRRGAFRGASIHRTEIQLAGAARSEFGKIAARTTQTWRWRNNDQPLEPQLGFQHHIRHRDAPYIPKEYYRISQVAIELLIIFLALCGVPRRRPGVEH